MDAVVGLVIGKVVQSVEENETLILGIEDQVEDLLCELRSFWALSEAAKNCNDKAVLEEVVQKIQKVVIDAEDAIDKYLVEERNHRGRGVLMKWPEKVSYYNKVNDAAKEMESIKKRAEKIRLDLELLQGGSLNNPQLPAADLQAHVAEDELVGFDEDAQTIKYRLTEKLDDTTVIAIVGGAGIGKTTLMKMIFNDRELRHEFFTRLWIYVSMTVNRKQIFMDIISNFTKETSGYKDMKEEQLAERIQDFLMEGKYFIVVDDLWRTEDWDYLRTAFPNNQKGSRILVTTRVLEVANHVDSKNAPYKLNFLSVEQSWELLQKKVFPMGTCPSYLESIGRRIAIKCNGLPQAVVVIAGVLDKNSSPAEWLEVAEDLFPLINWENQSYNELVLLNYNHLRNYTKDCFLYLAAFPMGHEIPVWKLIRLWIAEGFIPYSSQQNMEGTAETYLKDFVNRNLLMVVKTRADGEIKSCRLHDRLHEFCKSEAMKNNLFHEIDGARIEGNENYRRLSIRFSLKDFIAGSKDKSSGQHIRSLLTSTKLKIPKQHLAAIPKSYPLLKVFDAESLTFEILPKELYHLYHLRYLAISTDNNIIPKLFTHLWNLQTLVFKTSQSTVDVKAEIWNMPKLTHILSNASLQLPPPNSQSCQDNSSSSSSCPELLQTLSTISPKSCTEEIFDKMPNLKKLGVRGNIVAELLESKEGICLFDNIRKLEKLEKLKLMHEAFNYEATTLQRPIIPQADRFPSRLRKLTLSKTSFDWKDICVLGSLEELEVLKLGELAVKGDCWELNNDVVFRSLQFLGIGRTDLVYWSCEQSSFPVLRRLYISQCEQLNEVPLSFKDVKSLKIIDLFYTNQRAANSARSILRQKPNLDFVLSILPPHH
ncbi:PREDICTED: putative late blight resistance protein homolog R1B-14 [Ipomoea nil]|uniref:putative late blight resistance protein homolog R1B-14 n=1 Tax=Ipomoea nil TaxID=35883 RepID=UPI0009011A08|nr:PREDICTED: putative late blight resistance protein homolog R1B-14 [Ipomoea nil]